MAAMFALAFIGALGLVVDMGRLYVLKSQAQATADAAALSAAVRLDGTLKGLAESAEVGRRMAPRAGQAGIEFSTTEGGPWTKQPEASVECRFVRARLQLQTPMFFSRLLTGDAKGSVGATAVAGQVEKRGLKSGEFQCEAADLADRMRQDTDRDSKTYAEYGAADRGNGRRIVPCAGDGGISGFFVRDEAGVREPIGAYLEGSRKRGAGNRPGVFLVRLLG